MVRCAIVGSGNIGTDLLYKILRSDVLELGAMIGIDPDSEGLAQARDAGVHATPEGVDWLGANSDGFEIVFEATSAAVHRANAPRYEALGLIAVDLTPARLGPSVVPGVNLNAHLDAVNLNLITCGGQATVPIVAAVSRVMPVPYGEIVSTVASRSAGPGTRANIDEFTETTSAALVGVGGATTGKAIMILNPAEPPILMRNTVFCAIPDGFDADQIVEEIRITAASVASYVPGYRLVADPVVESGSFSTPGGQAAARVVVLIEVTGAGDYLPRYSGNLDIMTSAAVRVGEALAAHRSVAVRA